MILVTPEEVASEIKHILNTNKALGRELFARITLKEFPRKGKITHDVRSYRPTSLSPKISPIPGR